MTLRLFRWIAVATGLFLTLSAVAHHSQSEFDPTKPVTVEGTVTELEWKSPHARIYIDAVDENGETVNWNFELPSPNTLMRRGWNRKNIQAGDRVTVTGIRARNFPHIAIARTITDKDGKAVFAGTSDPAY
jgi:Family of unknown function (DUF6152)